MLMMNYCRNNLRNITPLITRRVIKIPDPTTTPLNISFSNNLYYLSHYRLNLLHNTSIHNTFNR